MTSPRPPRAAGTPAAWRYSATCSSSGPAEREYHVEIGGHAASQGVDVLVTVGPLAAAMPIASTARPIRWLTRARRPRCCPSCWRRATLVLVKASRGVGLEVVCAALQAGVA